MYTHHVYHKDKSVKNRIVGFAISCYILLNTSIPFTTAPIQDVRGPPSFVLEKKWIPNECEVLDNMDAEL